MLLGALRPELPGRQMNAQVRQMLSEQCCPDTRPSPIRVARCSQSAPSLPASTAQSPWLAGP